ncbi:hypothetical protein BD311DRAFT_759238 [Dichomitus squalens]|uniref:F-box domain-containing protein n=1 Tax=Dichomitus squalens TaxID=114155 RepID=A0A4Q9MPC0_9APHY|nr:hypothetical protein BD311DRAFT_759238 [Dichomitus squalens]
MRVLPGIFNVATRFLGRAIRRDCLDRLPNDLLVDVLFDYLDVKDIIRMRRVSRLYYELTHHAAVWKRLLRRIDVPLPPAPLTPKRPLSKISGLEAERLVVRAYSLDMNWRRHHPRALREWSFDAQRRVLAMTLLPGGDYLVASVSNRAGDRYYLVVYAMNAPGAPQALTAVETTTKAYDLQAKYMTIKEQRSIVIAYLRRDYRNKKDRMRAMRGYLPDVSSYSTQYSVADVQFKYECSVLQLSLHTLETLASIPYPSNSREYRYVAEALPKPFNNLFMLTSKSQLSSPVLAEMYGSAYLALVRADNDIIFKRLEGGGAATLTCLELPVAAERSHHIRAIQLLPQESAVFVVREIGGAPGVPHSCPAYAVETYRALECGDAPVTQLHAAEQCIIAWDLGHLTHLHLPEFPSFTRPEDLIAEDKRPAPVPPPHPALRPATPRTSSSARSPSTKVPRPPPPICMIGRAHPQCGRDESIVRMLFLAQRFEVDLPPTPPYYDRHGNPIHRTQIVYRTALERNQTWTRRATDYNAYLRIIPALTRPLVYAIPWDDTTDAPKVLDVRPVIDRGWQRPPRLEDGVVRHPEGLVGCPSFDGGPQELDANVTAFAWDETIGRLLVAEESSNEIMVFDFAAEPVQHFDKTRYPIPLQDIPNPDIAMGPHENPWTVIA